MIRDQYTQRLLTGTQTMTPFHTLTACKRSLTGSCSWAQGFLKCWSESLRELTINPWNNIQMLFSNMRVNLKNKIKKSKRRQEILIKLYTTFESTSQIFLRVSSTGAFVYNRHMETIKYIIKHKPTCLRITSTACNYYIN